MIGLPLKTLRSRFRAAPTSLPPAPSTETYGAYEFTGVHTESRGFWPLDTENPITTGNPFTAGNPFTTDNPFTTSISTPTGNPSSTLALSTDQPKGAHLSSGEIAGIAIGSVLAIAAIVSLALILCLRRHGQRRRQMIQDEKLAEVDNDEEVLSPPQPQLLVLHSEMQRAEAVGGPKNSHLSSPNVQDDPPTYEEVQHGLSQHEDHFAPGAVSNGFQQYIFQPRTDDGPKLNI